MKTNGQTQSQRSQTERTPAEPQTVTPVNKRPNKAQSSVFTASFLQDAAAASSDNGCSVSDTVHLHHKNQRLTEKT